MAEQTVLDMCCGSRIFWFDKTDPRAIFTDIRVEQTNSVMAAGW